MQRKEIIIRPYLLYMRTSRYLTRLRDHSASALALPRISTLCGNCEAVDSSGRAKKLADYRSFQFDSDTRFIGYRVLFGSQSSYGGIVSSNLSLRRLISSASIAFDSNHNLLFRRTFFTRAKEIKKIEVDDDLSQRAVTTALWCNFLVFSLKFGVWLATSSHVMLAEVVHSVADFANQPPANIQYAALVIGGSFFIEGASLVVAIHAVRKGAAAEGMKVRDYVWRGHDPTSVAVMTEDGAAVTGLLIAAASLVAVNKTGNAIYDPIGSIIVGNLLGMVAIFLIQRNRHALLGRAIDNHDMERVLHFLRNDPVVDAVYDCKSEVIGPGFFRFKAEIDFNGVVLVQNYLNRTGREEWARQFREAGKEKDDDSALLMVMSNYGEEVVTALGSEVDRLEKEIQEIVPGIRHVDIEAHNPIVPSP
ncbi:Metal tolerance protein C4 [Sarracenia purpurea var. burkii]